MPWANISKGGAIQADDVGARDPEKDVAHVHHARITEHPIEPLLRDRDEADVDDVAQQQHDEQRVPVLRALRHERQGEAQESVEAEFLQNTRVQHRRRRRSRRVSFRRPGVKRKERNQDAKADQQEEENLVLRMSAAMPPLAAAACSARRSKLRRAGGTLR